MNLPSSPSEPLSREEVSLVQGTIPHSQEELPLVNLSRIGTGPQVRTITFQEIVPHVPTTNLESLGTNVSLFQFPPIDLEIVHYFLLQG